MGSHITTFERQHCCVYLRTIDAQRIDFDQGFADVHHANVDEFNCTIVGRLRTLNGHFVANFDTEGTPGILASSVHGTIDIDLARTVVEIPVTIVSIGDTNTSTSHEIGLRVGSGDDLGTGGLRNLGDTLNNIDFLYVTATADSHRSRASGSGIGRERDRALTSRTAGRRNGQPVGHIANTPAVGCLDRQLRGATIGVKRHVGGGHLEVAKINSLFL